MTAPTRRILIAGGGIAGLTAALAFASHGAEVEVFERRARRVEIGAGVQISPNATRILARLGVLPALEAVAVRPDAVVLRSAARLAGMIGRVPLGDAAVKRWGSPYLVAHRADLHAVLADAVDRHDAIRMISGAIVRDVRLLPDHPPGLAFDSGAGAGLHEGHLIVGADGVWSAVRWLSGGGESEASRRVAWRRTLAASDPVASLFSGRDVEAFLHPGFHLVAYPMRGGAHFNIVAFARTPMPGAGWTTSGDPAALRAAMGGVDPALRKLAADGTSWTTFPIHTVSKAETWTRGGRLALIGDAAHAMSPFAAQGAAMAIEDAQSLADAFMQRGAAGLGAWEETRRERIDRVRRRGTFNRVMWHARGPLAFGRNLVLKSRGDHALMADLDWLYGGGSDT